VGTGDQAAFLMTPKGAALRALVAEYLRECDNLSSLSIAKIAKETAFEAVFHASFSAESVLSAYAGQMTRFPLKGVRHIVARIPALIAMGQLAAAEVELRRYLELFLWCIYFSDHSREWAEFQSGTDKGFSRDQRSPIAFAARRELAFYLDYAKELMLAEPSELGTEAVREITVAVHRLNSAVHPGKLANPPSSLIAFEDVTKEQLVSFGRLQKAVFWSTCIVLSAFKVARFNALPAGPRGHLDWLLPVNQRRRLRGGPFGLAQS
jgi:hypothetical protein